MMFQWLASPEWTRLVEALLHTLWQGVMIAVGLGQILRRSRNPVWRYRCSLIALGGVLLSGLITWAALMPAAAPHGSQPAMPPTANAIVTQPSVESPVQVVSFPAVQPTVTGIGWTAWLAFVWLAGMLAMLGRAGIQVAGAEQLRRSCRPVTDPHLIQLFEEAGAALQLARRVRLALTDRLTSPAVAGVLVPTLVLPLSLTTTLSPEQIRMILLHELAHIRRGDYLANLFQLLAEAVLFFNPAVWWISHQIRAEREACCDAAAIALSGEPAEYAQTLLCVAESILQPPPVAAPGFGGPRPSSLFDRVQRLLVPGYRPALRLTWRAMILALLTGGGLLVLCALGTQATLAAILSPQQRMDRIEKKMTEYGQNPELIPAQTPDGRRPNITVSGRIRREDGQPVPKWVALHLLSVVDRNSSGSFTYARKGRFTNAIPTGMIYLGVEVTNFAPSVLGPLDGITTNRLDNLEIVLKPGYNVPLEIVDADTRQLIPNATVATMYWMQNNGFRFQSWKSAADGSLALTHCADLPLDVTVNAAGYEIGQHRFDHVRAGQPLRLELRRGATVSGVVRDKTSGQPLAGAEVHLIYQSDLGHFEWDDTMHILARTDVQGAFTVNQLRPGVPYYLGVSAPGHERVQLQNVFAGQSNWVVSAGPELIVRGHILGRLDSLPIIDHGRTISFNSYETFKSGENGENSYGSGGWVLIKTNAGAATFEFTNQLAGRVVIQAGSQSFERTVTTPVADWTLDLTQPARSEANASVQPREVVLRFQSDSGVAPRGTVYVELPAQMDAGNPSLYREECKLTNGMVRVKSFVGAPLDYEPAHLVGFWFPRNLYTNVSAGDGPMIITVPVIPAGALYARAKEADGTPAGGLFYTVEELKRSPLRTDPNGLSDGSDSASDNAPRRWVSGPLPLGGKYQVIGWRGNSFCASRAVKLTEAQPDAEVELQFPPTQNFTGVVVDDAGQPVSGGEVNGLFQLSTGHEFRLKTRYTDSQGRFGIEDLTAGVGTYSVQINVPGFESRAYDLDWSRQPMRIQLERGGKLAGQVVEAATGYVIPHATVNAWPVSGRLPWQTTLTDGTGRFEFNTLGEGEYWVSVPETYFGNTGGPQKYSSGQTNLVLRVTPWKGGTLKPVAPDMAPSVPNPPSANVAPPTAPAPGLNPPAAKPVASTNGTSLRVFRLQYALPPAKLNRLLRAAGVTTPPTVITYNEYTLLLLAQGSEEQLNRINAAVEKWNTSAATNTVSAQANSVSTRPADGGIVPPATATNLFTRVFRMTPKNFFRGLKLAGANLPGLQTDTADQDLVPGVKQFAQFYGIHLEAPKSMFYNHRLGLLMVRGTATDLDRVQTVIQFLNEPPVPQVHIQARFLEIPEAMADRFTAISGLTNRVTTVLSNHNIRPLLKALATIPGAETLAQPEGLTASGRQMRMMSGNSFTVITGFDYVETPAELLRRQAQGDSRMNIFLGTNRDNAGFPAIIPETNSLETGVSLDTIANVLTDRSNIVLQVTAADTKFFGYADTYTKKNWLGFASYPDPHWITNSTGQTIRLPEALPTCQTNLVAWSDTLVDGQTVMLFPQTIPETEPRKLRHIAAAEKKSGRKFLVTFVTVDLVDAAGNLIRAERE